MMEIITANLKLFAAIMDKGGWVMWVLFFLNLMLWYGLGYRRFSMQRGIVDDIRLMVSTHMKEDGKGKCRGILDYAIVDALKAASEARSIGKRPRNYIEDALWPYERSLKRYSFLVMTIVVLAPLIGLLGTVLGMIETFDALQTSAMFSQGASISGGISKALFTTELGLIVAVPGLIMGRALDKLQRQYTLEFEQITDIISTKESSR
ncbi:MAG: MotA/TolQ/ExbB proton channel family protein [Desulfosalsimonadaceae bacterium]